MFFDPHLMRVFFTLYSFLLDHLDRILVNHLNLHSSIYPIKYLLWLSANGGGWDCTVQGSSPHKCNQKNCCSAFNAVVAAFLLDISVYLFFFVRAWSLSLSLEILGRSPKSPKYLFDQYSSYPRMITSSDFIPPPFPYVILYSGVSPIIYSSSDESTSSDRG